MLGKGAQEADEAADAFGLCKGVAAAEETGEAELTGVGGVGRLYVLGVDFAIQLAELVGGKGA